VRYMRICIHTHTERERERERDRGIARAHRFVTPRGPASPATSALLLTEAAALRLLREVLRN